MLKRKCKAEMNGICCDRDARADGYCYSHYIQVKRHGHVTHVPIHQWVQHRERKNKKTASPCTVEINGQKCDQKSIARGLCVRHYGQVRRQGVAFAITPHAHRFPRGSIPCWAELNGESCTEPQVVRGYCDRHLAQITKYGRVIRIAKVNRDKDVGSERIRKTNDGKPFVQVKVSSGLWINKSRVVFESTHGITLRKWQHVYHIDGDLLNCSPDNLTSRKRDVKSNRERIGSLKDDQ